MTSTQACPRWPTSPCGSRAACTWATWTTVATGATSLGGLADERYSHKGLETVTKGVGGGIFEYKIDFGPGYSIYFGKDGERIVIILGGGTKFIMD